jgi:hypothetical protein
LGQGRSHHLSFVSCNLLVSTEVSQPLGIDSYLVAPP